VSQPDIEKKRGKRRRSARVYINLAELSAPEIAQRLAEVSQAFPPDDPEDDDEGVPAVSVRTRGRRMAKPETVKRDVSRAERKRLAAQGHALPDGSYPIASAEDLHNAAVLARTGHGDAEAARRLIARRAKELGVANPLESAEKSYLGDPYPVQEYASRRVSEPLTAGRGATATDDHGVGQGRNPGLAAHHGDLRQSSPAAFDAVSRLMTVFGDNAYGDRDITMTTGQVALSMFNAAGRAGTYDGMGPAARTPVRPADHIAQGSATPPNGGHGLADPQSHAVAMKASDRREIMRRHMFPGSGGAR